MGIHSDTKSFLKYRYKQAWIKTKDSEDHSPTIYEKSPVPVPGRRQAFYPRDANIVVFDATSKLKVPPLEMIENGLDFINKHLLYEAITFLGMDTGTEAFFICFDRGSPANKDNVHKERYAKLPSLDIDLIPKQKVFIGHETIVKTSGEWEQFINNKILNQEALHYITKTLIDPYGEFTQKTNIPKLQVYTPPPNKMLFLFGGLINEPNPNRCERERVRPDPFLFYVGNEEIQQETSYLNRVKNYKRVSGIYKHPTNQPFNNLYFKDEEQEKLLEGEVSAMYFSKIYSSSGKNVMIISGDGDIILHALLSCKDRIDHNGNFVNKLYLRLTIGSSYEDIDVNLLYKLMCEDSIFLSNGISDPAPYIVIGSILVKNDYFKNYCVGIKTINNGKEDKCPYVLYTLLAMIKDYKFLVKIPTESMERSSLQYPMLEVTIDEELFIKFTHHCYVTKYLHSSEKNNDDKDDKKRRPKTKSTIPNRRTDSKKGAIDTTNIEYRHISNYEINLVKTKTSKFKDPDRRVPDDEMIRVHARMTEWVLLYLYNSYRGSCVIPSPLSIYQSKPYYGWVISLSDNSCIQGNYVTKKKRETTECSWFRGPLSEILVIQENGVIKILTGEEAISKRTEMRNQKSNCLKEKIISIPQNTIISPLNNNTTITRSRPVITLKLALKT